ncbi:MAG: hypothetical protein AB7I41_25260 [Candidatus Sericytochromatia bacterium]
MHIKLGLMLLCLLLTGCPPAEQNTQASATPTPDPSASLAVSVGSPAPSGAPSKLKPSKSANPTADLAHFQGLFMAGEGLQLFKSCGSKEEIWVEDPDGELLKRHAALKGLIDLEPVYVELTGTVAALTSGEGFASGYRKALRVNAVQQVQPWMNSGTCFKSDFVAFGHKPEWTLRVLTKNAVYFKSLEGEFPIVESLIWQAPEQTGNQSKYTFRYRSPETEAMQVIFSKEPCLDGAQTYAFKATIFFRGSTYEGCAKEQ